MNYNEVWATAGALLIPCSVLLGISAYSKFRNDIRTFEGAIEKYRLMPESWVPISARLIIMLEVAIVLFALLPFALDILALCLVGIGAAFTIAQGSAIIRKLDISCGCFGDTGSKISAKTIVLPMALLLIGFFISLLCWLTDPKLTVAGFIYYYGFGIASSVTGFALFETFRFSSVFKLKS